MGSRTRVAVPTAGVAVAGTVLAVVVNLATGDHSYWWLWLVVAAATIGVFGAQMWLYRRQATVEDPLPQVQATGVRSVAVYGNPAGPISTGDIHTTPAPQAPPATQPGPASTPPPPAPAPLPGAVTASGERSIAIHGNPGGEISTGDRS